MTQQKPLPIATGITGGCNAPSSFHPEVPPRDKIWACCWGDAAAAKARSVGRGLQGRGGGPRRCASSGEGDTARDTHTGTWGRGEGPGDQDPGRVTSWGPGIHETDVPYLHHEWLLLTWSAPSIHMVLHHRPLMAQVL